MDNLKNKCKFSEILDINDIMIDNILHMKFTDEKLEDKYNDFVMKNSRLMRILINLAVLIIIFIRISLNLRNPKYLFYYVDLALALFSTTFFIVINFFIKNLKVSKILNYVFSIMIIIKDASYTLFINFYFQNEYTGIKIRELYIMLMISITNLLFSIEYNFFFALVIFIINFGITILLFITQSNLFENERYIDILVFFFILVICIIIKRSHSLVLRENFLQTFKYERYFEYSFDIINNMNSLYFGIKNGKFLTYNNNFKNFINNSTTIKQNLQKHETEINKIDEYFKNEKKSNPNVCNTENNFNASFLKDNKNIENKLEIHNTIKELINKSNHINTEVEANKRNNSSNNILQRKKVDIKKDLEKQNSHCKVMDIKKNFLKDQEYYEVITHINRKSMIIEKEKKVFQEDLNQDVNINNRLSNEDHILMRIDTTANYEKNKIEENKNNSKINQSNEKKNFHKQIDLQFINENFEELVNELGNIYLRNIKLVKLAKNYSFLKGENLYSLYQEINGNVELEINKIKFNFLGEFRLEEENLYFEVYVHKNDKYSQFMDFLIHDISRVKEAENFEYYLKSNIFAKIAHEFKTPLNSIIGLIKKMKTQLCEQKNIQNTKTTLNQIESLSNYVIILIQDIIEYSKIYICNHQNKAKEKHQRVKLINLKISPINLKEITKFCRDVLRTILITKGKEKYVKIKYEFDKRIFNYKILSDEFRIKQILLNFISNAVKFTNSGSIKIKCTLDEDEKLKNNNFFPYVRVSIIDTGSGIKENNLNGLLNYKKNSFLNDSRNYNQEGSGLGLSIAKFLADKLYHKLEIQSCYSKGSTFSLLVKAEKIHYSNNSLILNTSNLLKKKFFSSDDIFYEDMMHDNHIRANSSHKYFYKNLSDNFKKSKYIQLFANNKIKRNSCKTKNNYDQNFIKLHENIYEKFSNNMPDSRNFRSDHKDNFLCLNLEECSVNNFFIDLEKFEKKDNHLYKKNSKESHSENFFSSSSQIKKKIAKISNNSDSRNNLEKEISLINKNFKSSASDPYFLTDMKENETVKVSQKMENPYKLSRFFSSLCSSNEASSKDQIRMLNRNHRLKDNIISSGGRSEEIFSINGRSKFPQSQKIKINNISNQFSSKEINLNEKFKKIILIVDDHVFIRDSLKNLIQKIIVKKKLTEEYRIKEARDGSEILSLVVKDQFKNNQIKCILTDENMEFINGSDAVKILRDLEKGNKIKPVKIASITAFQDEAMKQTILGVGVDYIIPKPCTETNIRKFFDDFKIFEL